MMETASFRTLSPNTMAYKSWSAFIALNNARVDTGSVADINEPNAKLKIMQIIIKRTRLGIFYSKIRSQETSMANTDLNHEDPSFKSTLNFACLFAKKNKNKSIEFPSDIT